jgi:hypothetical protein
MSSGKQVSPFRKVLAVLVLLVTTVGSMLFGFWLTGGWGGQELDQPPPAPFDDVPPLARAITISMVLGFLSVLVLLVGGGMYAVILGTRLFFSDFSRPVWSRFKARLFLANIFVPLPVMVGVSGLITAMGTPLLIGRGVSYQTGFILLFFIPFVLLQLVSIWLSIWTPLVKRLTRARLLALGVKPARLARGIFLGISNPAKKSSRKLGLIEEDVGMLWITRDELVYEGDDDEFRVQREQCLSIERVADTGSVSAYFGNVHIILTFARDGRAPRKVRLHPESSMTMTSTARASDWLANKLEKWKRTVPEPTTSD